MYQVYFDNYPLYDPRDDRLYLRDPDVHLAVGEAGEMSFTIDPDHPYVDRLSRLRGIVELRAEGRPIFKGRIRKDTRGFELSREIKAEGLLACLNDSLIPPFNFPGDFKDDPEYQAAAASGNVIRFFLSWLLAKHNSQVGPAQQIHLGDVTVADPNNYITRSASEYLTTMEVVRKKLESTLGGYLLPDYSGETTVLHYYADLPLTNVQEVEFGENLLDLVSELDSADTHTAILPIGAEGLTLAELADGEISPGIWKEGLIVYHKELEDDLGGRITKRVDWDDVTVARNLQTKAATLLTTEGVKTAQTITVKAVDLGSLEDLPRFVVGRYVRLNSAPHGFEATYPLMELEPDILDPGNTKITMGKTALTLLGFYADRVDEVIQSTKNELLDHIANVENEMTHKIEAIDGTFFYIKYSAYADGHVMTNTPQDDTQYMGTCSTNEPTAPTDYQAYTWCRIRGQDGKDGTDGTPGQPGADGKSQYFHVKYSNDGKTFTANNGETLGTWMGTLVDSTEADSTVFSAYTWRKIVGEDGKNGIDGADGHDGVSTYFFVKFSENANGNPMTETPTSTTKYMGVCSTTSSTAPSSYSAYTWTLIRGQDGKDGTNGTPGEPGADGRTQYLHIKYSDDGLTFTANDGETLGAWIGTLVDFNEADSTVFSAYTWKKFTEDVDDELDEIRQTMRTQYTEILRTNEEILLAALESYTETKDLEAFRQTVESQFQVLADEISMTFTETLDRVTEVNGDLQRTVETINKHFDFDIDGLTIRAGEHSMSLKLDNGLISFQRDGQQFGWWDGVDFHTGNIVVDVNERAQFGNFAAIPRSNGSLSWLKVRG